MGKYCIVENGLLEQHAGSKARCDVAQILLRHGWIPIYVKPLKVRYNVSYLERIRVIPNFVTEWRNISKKLERGDTLLIQYPLDMYPKVAMTAMKYLYEIKKKGAKIGIIIHDIDSLRMENEDERKWYNQAEHKFFSAADWIIAHNPVMEDYLRKEGFQMPIYSLEIFDYLEKGKIEDMEDNCQENIVTIAGNLSKEKAGYIYKIPENAVRYNLYGPNLEERELGKNIEYKGSFQPDVLPKVLNGKFGLVWDGDSIDKCAGQYGEYIRYNNPHKTSLYLACGIPVVVWNKAAIADFIEKKRIGITVGSLNEMSDIIENMSDGQYKELKKNAVIMGDRLREGQMLSRVLEKLDI